MEEDFYGDGSADNFMSDRQRLMIMKDEARKKNKKVRLADFEKKYGDQGYQVDDLGEVFRDNQISGKREFFGDFQVFKPSKPKRIGDTPKSNPIDTEAAFIESEVAEFDGPQPSATTQMKLANYVDLANDVSAQPTSAGTNTTSTRDKLKSRAVGPAGISERAPKGYINTGGKFASLNSVEGKRAKMRLDRLRKLQMKIKAGK